MQMVGIGIVGCGMVAKFHAEAIGLLPQAKLVAACSRNTERASKFGAQFSIPWRTNYQEFLASPDIQIVDICTPSGTHAGLGIAAARAGKHVLVEKPIDITPERAQELINACREAGVKLGVILQSRFMDAPQRIKQAFDAGRFGRPIMGNAYVKWFRTDQYYASGEWRGTLALDGGGAMINQAIHTIDLLRWIMGPVESVYALTATLAHNIEVEDTAVAALRFKNGALGTIEATTSVYPGFKRRVEITGKNGTAILDGDSISTWAFVDQTGEETVEIAADITDGSADPAAISAEGHRRQIADMIDAVLNDRAPAVDGVEGKKALDLIAAIYRSAAEGRAVKL